MTMVINIDGDTKTSTVQKPCNNYNIFYTLERVRLIESRKKEGGKRSPSPPSNVNNLSNETGYGCLELPPLPPRYAHLAPILPSNWYVPGKNKRTKRKHKVSHGLISFQEIATIVSQNWRSIDPATKTYTEDVAQIQKARYEELKTIEEMENDTKGRWNSSSTGNTDGSPYPKMTNDFDEISQGSLKEIRSSATKTYTEDVAQIQKARYDELKKIEEMENEAKGSWNSSSTGDTDGPPHPKMTNGFDETSQGSVEEMRSEGRYDFPGKSEQSLCNTAGITTSMQPDYYTTMPPPHQPHNNDMLQLPERDQLSYDAMGHEPRNPHRSSSMTTNTSRTTHPFTRGNQRGECASSSPAHYDMYAPPRPLALDQILSAYDVNTRTIFDEADISDEEILEAYHKAD